MAESTGSRSTKATASAAMHGYHVCEWRVDNDDGSVCDERCTTVEDLAVHINKEHLTARKRHSMQQETSYKCQWQGCDHKAYKNKESLVIHIRQHTGERPLKCDIKGCEIAFAYRTSLRDHKVTHTDKYLKCTPKPGCSKQYKHASAVRRHLQRRHASHNNAAVANVADDHHDDESEGSDEDMDNIPSPTSSLEVNPGSPTGESEGSPFSISDQ
eukprot:scpid68181/ scgid23592/ Transcriptional activator cubitus interruptus; ci form of 155 kDa; ci full length protein; Transcriptional repressor cubitus interruptus; ci C-terminally truncated form; ci form of 75 kDa